MRRQHTEQIERWANFVKNNPNKWKKIHTEFINAQFEKHKYFINKLKQKNDCFNKLIKLYNIKNIDAYSKILRPKMQILPIRKKPN